MPHFELESSRTRPNKSIATFSAKVATAFGLGLLPKAPGTWGSLAGLPLACAGYYLCQALAGNAAGQGQPLSGIAALWALGLLLLLSWASTYCIAQTEAAWQSHDDKSIVIDEVLGQMLALIWFPPSWLLVFSGFLLFRFWDITKLGPIGWADRHLTTAFGTLLDDLIAGAFTAIMLTAFFL